MKKTILVLFVLLVASSVIAQNGIRLDIKSLPEYHNSTSDIYAAGSFNGWNPQDEQFKFKKDDKSGYYLELKLNPGSYEYKITRGAWDKVECKKNGAAAENRILYVPADTTIELNIEEWQDHFPAKARAVTASKNVHIISTSFWIPQLKRTRRVWIYLPEGYNRSSKKYPVLYMHDGQNLFDDATSYAGEWGVDEYLDSVKAKKCIVVGIDNGGNKRLNEYSPYNFDLKGIAAAYKTNKGEGGAYVNFLVKTLKPFIDRKYRTLRDKSNTFIAGSSMGGLISLYAVLKYPKVFGGAGVFSPAFWVSGKNIFTEIKRKGRLVNSKLYFYAGKQESETMVPDVMKAFEDMLRVSRSKMTTVIRDEGRHNEPTWRREFPLFYEWMIK